MNIDPGHADAPNHGDWRRSVPFRLGFFLERTGVTSAAWPNVPYRGVDRLWFTPSPEDVEACRQSGQGRLADLWAAYWDAEDSRDLNVDRRLARQLQSAFADAGIRFDLIYVEITQIPHDIDGYPRGATWSQNLAFVLERWASAHQRLPQRPAGLRLLGFDVSHPVPTFHSVILQPGLHHRLPDLPRSLNEHGLFPELSSAAAVLPIANAMDYGPLPFCVLAVWEDR